MLMSLNQFHRLLDRPQLLSGHQLGVNQWRFVALIGQRIGRLNPTCPRLHLAQANNRPLQCDSLLNRVGQCPYSAAQRIPLGRQQRVERQFARHQYPPGFLIVIEAGQIHEPLRLKVDLEQVAISTQQPLVVLEAAVPAPTTSSPGLQPK